MVATRPARAGARGNGGPSRAAPVAEVAAASGPVLRIDSGGGAFRCYGAALDLWNDHASEVMIAGPYATGKTLTWLHKLNAVACRYPGARILIVRKTYRSLVESACVTYERKVLDYPPGHPLCPVVPLGGTRPTSYEYPNGSRIVLGGLDNPDKLLSSEWDMVGVPQAEELSLGDWEALIGRTTGRAGNVRYPQVIGDCNPGPPSHWILRRSSLSVHYSKHEDNPSLFDPVTGEITERGRQEMAALDALTGIRYKRGRLGLWVAAEGVVYEGFDRAAHLVDRFRPPQSWPRIWAVDFGYTNPFVWQCWAMDDDGRLFLTHEIYKTGILVEDAARLILRITGGQPAPVAIVCDHDAEDRATLERHLGMRTVAAYKAITPGREAVESRLRAAGDGRPRLFIMRDTLRERDEALSAVRKPLCLTDELEVYAWPVAKDGKPVKETPIKDNDHGCDAMRYAVAHVDKISGKAPAAAPPDDRPGRRAGKSDTIIGGMDGLKW